jgi:hypothetical protein
MSNDHFKFVMLAGLGSFFLLPLGCGNTSYPHGAADAAGQATGGAGSGEPGGGSDGSTVVDAPVGAGSGGNTVADASSGGSDGKSVLDGPVASAGFGGTPAGGGGAGAAGVGGTGGTGGPSGSQASGGSGGTPVTGATYWISPTGTAATLAACSGATPLSDTACCSYDKAQGPGVAPGDTAYYRGGTYALPSGAEAIKPTNSGSPSGPITFASYNDEDVVFQGSGTYSHSIDINCSAARGGTSNKRAYIRVHGSPGHPIVFNHFYKHLWILASDHNEISYCKFYGMAAEGHENTGSYIYVSAQYNWIHNNTFAQWGDCTPYGTDAGGPFQMGINDADDHLTRYNLVEDNDMSQGGHHVAWLGGTYNIYRNNYFHNEPWCPIDNPTFATRVLIQNGYATTPGTNVDGVFNLNEGNRIGYGGPKNKSEVGGNVAQVMGAYNVWRYNTWAQSYLSAVWLYDYNDYGEITQHNKVYNNTFWHGGYGYYQDYYDLNATAPASSSWSKSFHHPINIEDDPQVANNVFMNNLFYQNNTNGSYSLGDYCDFVTTGADHYSDVAPKRQIISNNWTDDLGDPKFVDILGTPDPTSARQWNLGLQSGSPCIDGGTYLTTAKGAGSDSISLTVADATFFFYDAGNVSAAWPSGNLNNDWIAIGVASNVVQISSIDYASNAITLAFPMTWAANAPVWLYKKSDGAQVLYGSAPDYGAYELSGR